MAATCGMELAEDSYDAAAPMDLFRANEKINANKRRWLASEIEHSLLPKSAITDRQIQTAIKKVIAKLASRKKVVIYQQPLQLSESFAPKEDGLLAQVTAEIARLLATGQIDINTDLTISFVGDKRGARRYQAACPSRLWRGPGLAITPRCPKN